MVAQTVNVEHGARTVLVGKAKLPTPSIRQTLVGRTGSNNGTGAAGIFASSTNPPWPRAGWNMISLKTTGPTRGKAFAPPGVLARNSVKSNAPSERWKIPKGSSELA